MRLSSLSNMAGTHFVCLAGQSNANGYQTPADTGSYAPRKGQHIYNNISGQWERLQQNSNNGGSFQTYTGSVGIEMDLLRLMQEHYGADQYLLKYGAGGTPLAPKESGEDYDWQPYTAADQMFNGFVGAYRNAVATFPVQRPKMKVLIWIQGENDTATLRADNYLGNIRAFHKALKNMLDLPDLLLLQTLLADTQTGYDSTGRGKVNAAKIAYSTFGNRYVNIDGAEIGADHVHFTANGQAYIAQKVFNVLKTML